MNRRKAQHFWIARLLLAAWILAPLAPALADEPEPSVPGSEFRGKVLGMEGQPAAGVEILTYHLATADLFIATTDDRGVFVLIALPYGYFDLAVRSGDGLYVANQVVNVSPLGDNVVDFRLQAFFKSSHADNRAFPGANEVPVGLARVINQRDGESFWRSPRGISIAGGGGALLLVLLTGGSDPPASPFAP